MSRENVATELWSVVHMLNEDELSTLLFLAKRLLKGRGAYGPLDLATDQRNWLSELNEELADAVVYVAFLALQKRRAGDRDTSCRGNG